MKKENSFGKTKQGCFRPANPPRGIIKVMLEFRDYTCVVFVGLIASICDERNFDLLIKATFVLVDYEN